MLLRGSYCQIKVEAKDKPCGFVMVPVRARTIKEANEIALLNGYRLNDSGSMYIRPSVGYDAAEAVRKWIERGAIG